MLQSKKVNLFLCQCGVEESSQFVVVDIERIKWWFWNGLPQDKCERCDNFLSIKLKTYSIFGSMYQNTGYKFVECFKMSQSLQIEFQLKEVEN